LIVPIPSEKTRNVGVIPFYPDIPGSLGIWKILRLYTNLLTIVTNFQQDTLVRCSTSQVAGLFSSEFTGEITSTKNPSGRPVKNPNFGSEEVLGYPLAISGKI